MVKVCEGCAEFLFFLCIMLGPDAWYGYAVIVIGRIAFPYSRCWVIFFGQEFSFLL